MEVAEDVIRTASMAMLKPVRGSESPVTERILFIGLIDRQAGNGLLRLNHRRLRAWADLSDTGWERWRTSVVALIRVLVGISQDNQPGNEARCLGRKT